uniref:Uncharacterized protein n=1 Tax=Opuntia streptacantha TaxID=393608 RepID=A0A7C9AXQ7_OPUST
MNRGPFVHPPIIIVNHSSNSSLLQHHFRNPHSIRLSLSFISIQSSPRQIPLIGIVPFQQRSPNFNDFLLTKLQQIFNVFNAGFFRIFRQNFRVFSPFSLGFGAIFGPPGGGRFRHGNWEWDKEERN